MTLEQTGQEGIAGRKRDRKEPESEQTAAVPRLDRPLRGGLHGLPGEEQIRGAVDPGEPAEAGHEEPLGNLGAGVDAAVKLEHRPDADEEEGEQEHRGSPVGIFEPLHPGAVSGENGKRAEENGHIPEHCGAHEQDGQEAVAERPSAEAGHQPDPCGESCLRGPSVKEEIAGHRGKTAVGQEADPAEEAGGDQFDREHKR